MLKRFSTTLIDRKLADAWQREHKLDIVRRALVIGFVFMATMLPLDYFVFPQSQAQVYSPYRIFFLMCLVLELFCLAFKNPIFQMICGIRGGLSLLRGTISISLFYNFFLFSCTENYSSMVTWGNVIVVAACSTFIHQLKREQIIYHIICLSSAVVVMMLCYNNTTTPKNAQFMSGIFHVAIAHAFFMLFFKVLQLDFYNNLTIRFNSLCQIVPQKMARHMTVKEISINEDEYFKPRLMQTVCLCSDWRDYQKMAGRETPENMSKIFETYYDLVFQKLAIAAPSGNYFADWTADELIVIFFDQFDNEDLIKREAMAFAKVLAEDIQIELEKKGIILTYDIGLSYGKGFLGLQGPKGKKKTTITGEVAGIAKRLQTEAKELRVTTSIAKDPLVFIDGTLKPFVDSECPNIFPFDQWREWEALSKNIKGITSFYWQTPSQTLSTLKLTS